ncbi:hypothetical protein LTR43_006437 [Exophiala xenobiotica]
MPAAQRTSTVDSFASPKEGITEYTKFESSDIFLPDPASVPQGPLEQPKQAFRKGFWANFTKLLPHMTASIVAAIVVGINFRNLYWMDLVDPTVEILPGITQGGALNALQLAAKLVELVLVASLGSIVLHVAQSHLVGDHGLPLGLITNIFSIGSGDFLRTKAFWASAWTSKAHYWRFWLFSLFATLLATLAGPSSAIAVIPSLNWFPVDEPFDNNVLPYYVFNESTTLWPDVVTGASVNSASSGIDCTEATFSTLIQEVCPAGDFRDLYSWSGNLLFVNSSSGSNASIPDSRGDTRRILSTQSCNSDFDGRASGITLNTFITGALTQWWSFAWNNYDGLGLRVAQPRLTLRTPIYAPRVEVLCDGFDYSNVSEVENRGAVSFPSLETNRTLPTPGFRLPYNGTLNATDVQWVKMPTGAGIPTLGVAVRVPWIYFTNASMTETRQATEIHALCMRPMPPAIRAHFSCFFLPMLVQLSDYSQAQWVPVFVWYEPRSSDQVSFYVEGDLPDTCLTIPRVPATGRSIRDMAIDEQYADAINQPIPFDTGNVPAITAMLNQLTFPQGVVAPTNETGYAFKSPFLGSAVGDNYVPTTNNDVRKSRATVISTLLAGVITDGLARIAGGGIFPYSAAMFLTNNTDSNDSLVGRFVVSSAVGGQDESLNATSADVENWLRIDPVFSRYGYGYRWEGSTTAQFGIIILLVHVTLAIIHSAFILYKVLILRDGLVSSWTTVAEFLALAMNSSPSPRLQNTCAGVNTASTWRQEISVRETYRGHLELVVGADDKARHRKPQTGQVYGHLVD